MANQAFNTDGSGNFTAEAQGYYNDFFNLETPPHGRNIQNELYQLYATQDSASSAYTQQVLAAIQFAYCRYICFLMANGQATDSNGQLSPNCSSLPSVCPACSS